MLTKIVTDLTFAQGKDPDNDIFWGIVAERMGNRRGRQQCRIKWCVYVFQEVCMHILTSPQDGCFEQDRKKRWFQTSLESSRRLHPST